MRLASMPICIACKQPIVRLRGILTSTSLARDPDGNDWHVGCWEKSRNAQTTPVQAPAQISDLYAD